MHACHPWLTCEAIRKDVDISNKMLGQGAVKMVSHGKWQNYPVAVSELIEDSYLDDFNFNLKTMIFFHEDEDEDFLQNIVQLVGFCKATHTIVTDYHFLGSSDKLDIVLQTHLPHMDNLATRFSLCVNFVSILHKLHTHHDGGRILCDANTPAKALSQFLLTDDLRLSLNDMDALPVLNEGNNFTIKCGHRELYGDYVAPEQLWPYDDKSFDDNLMHGYDEKVDIWKVPDVCLTLIGKAVGVNNLLLNLFNIHARCKYEQPKLRPSASDILHVYESVQKKLFLDHAKKKEHIHDML